jgi:hypothetical protein
LETVNSDAVGNLKLLGEEHGMYIQFDNVSLHKYARYLSTGHMALVFVLNQLFQPN